MMIVYIHFLHSLCAILKRVVLGLLRMEMLNYRRQFFTCVLLWLMAGWNTGWAFFQVDYAKSLHNPSGLQLRLENDLTFAYDYMWRGVTMTGDRPSVQGAFTVALPYYGEGWVFDPYFYMMIANTRKGHAAGYEQKVFHLGLQVGSATFALERVLYFTLGDSIIYPTKVEKMASLEYDYRLGDWLIVRPKITGFVGQNSDLPVEWIYHLYTKTGWLLVDSTWGYYEPHGRYWQSSFGVDADPYTLGIRYAFLDANPDSFYPDQNRWYLFVRYKTTLYPSWSVAHKPLKRVYAD